MNFQKFKKDKELTTAQRGIYFSHLLDNTKANFNTAHFREINGPLNIELFRQAVKAVVDRVPAYRSTVKNYDECLFIVETNIIEEPLDFMDLSLEPNAWSSAISWMEHQRLIPFDLDRGPLFDYVLIKLSSLKYLLYHCYHHIIVDGAGVYQFERWVFEAYESLKQNRKINFVANLSDAYEIEQKYRISSQFQVDENYWKKELFLNLVLLELD